MHSSGKMLVTMQRHVRGRLAVIDSEEKLVRVMSALGGSLEADLWIGGSDLIGNFNSRLGTISADQWPKPS